MAVDALSDKRVAAAGEEAAALDFMTGEAAVGEIRDVALWKMDVVTR